MYRKSIRDILSDFLIPFSPQFVLDVSTSQCNYNSTSKARIVVLRMKNFEKYPFYIENFTELLEQKLEDILVINHISYTRATINLS